MLDLICRRYPGRRPSDYLEIEDGFTAIQLDYAIALKHETQDIDFDMKKFDSIRDMLKGIGSALGIEYTERKPKAPGIVNEEPIDEDVALALFGAGKGTKIIHGKSSSK